MTHIYRTAALLALAMSLAAGAAQANFWASNRMEAAGIPAKAGYFEVFRLVGASARDYYCVAGEYIRYGKHLPASTDIYVVRGPGPSVTRPGRHSVIFSHVKYDDIPDVSEAEKGYSVSVSWPGFYLSAGHGAGYCNDSRRRFFRFR